MTTSVTPRGRADHSACLDRTADYCSFVQRPASLVTPPAEKRRDVNGRLYVVRGCDATGSPATPARRPRADRKADQVACRADPTGRMYALVGSERALPL